MACLLLALNSLPAAWHTVQVSAAVPAAALVPLHTYCVLSTSAGSRMPFPLSSTPVVNFWPPLAQLAPAGSVVTAARVELPAAPAAPVDPSSPEQPRKRTGTNRDRIKSRINDRFTFPSLKGAVMMMRSPQT